LKIGFENGIVAEQFFKLAGQFIEEGNICLTKEDVSIKSIDVQQICLIEINIPRIVFKQYEVEEDKKIGIDFDLFNKEINKLKNKLVTISDSDGKLTVVIGNLMTKTIPIIECEVPELPTPNIPYDTEIEINRKTLLEIAKECYKTSSTISIEANSYGIEFSASKDGTNSNAFLGKEAKEIINFKAVETVKALFPTEYLISFLKNCFAETVSLKLKTDSPVKITADFNGAKIMFLLANKMRGD